MPIDNLEEVEEDEEEVEDQNNSEKIGKPSNFQKFPEILTIYVSEEKSSQYIKQFFIIGAARVPGFFHPLS